MRDEAGGGLAHPLPLAAIAILLLNDHVWKQAHPSWLTGKLSDLAGLAFFPLLLEAFAEAVLALRGRYRGPSRRRLLASLVLTGVAFAWMKTSVVGADAYALGLGALQWPFRAIAAALRNESLPAFTRAGIVRDPSDLLALPALGLAYLAARSRGKRSVLDR